MCLCRHQLVTTQQRAIGLCLCRRGPRNDERASGFLLPCVKTSQGFACRTFKTVGHRHDNTPAAWSEDRCVQGPADTHVSIGTNANAHQQIRDSQNSLLRYALLQRTSPKGHRPQSFKRLLELNDRDS